MKKKRRIFLHNPFSPKLAHQRRVHAAARMQVLRLAVTVLADGERGVYKDVPSRLDGSLHREKSDLIKNWYSVKQATT